MATAIFPASLPGPMKESFNEALDDTIIRTSMDTGPTKRRRRFTARKDTLNLVYRFDLTELATFRTFYGTTINDGATEYDMTHPITLATITVAIMSPIKFVNIAASDFYEISFGVEMQP